MSPPPYPEGGQDDATNTCGSTKRRRIRGDGEEVRPWAWLPEDLVELIGWQVLAGDLLDYVRFRAVCSHWNSTTVRPRGRGLVDPRFHPRRWMMLPEGHGLHPGHPKLRGYVRFLSLSTGTLVRVHLPLFDDHVVLESVDGLLLLLLLHRDHDTTVRLLHPFTGDIAELPALSSLLPQMERYPYMSEDCKRRELRLYLRGVSAAGAITVILALHARRLVAYATPGDQRWTLSSCKLPLMLSPPISFRGELFAVSPLGENNVLIWKIDPSLQSVKIVVECPLVAAMSEVHLVECGSELMLVGFSETSSADLVVYRVDDLISGRVVPIRNIGKHALFLGERSLGVTSSKALPSVLSNSITCSYRIIHGQRPIEHYHLDNGIWSPAVPMDNPPASPYTIVHHIFTCCYRSYWNKAVMFHGAIRPDWSVKVDL